MKTYEIKTIDDYEAFKLRLDNFIRKNEANGNKFQAINIVVKEWKKPKTSPQLKFYWVVIGEMAKAFRNVGYTYSKEEIHEFVKKASGHTQIIKNKDGLPTEITRSISYRDSEINLETMTFLIDFAIRWTAINLDYVIENPVDTMM